jgi:hypothetical protein
MSFTHGGDATMGGRIGIDPKPPTVGEEVTFRAGPNMELRIEIDPDGVFYVTTDADGKAVFEIPGGVALIVSAPGSTDWTPSSTTIGP